MNDDRDEACSHATAGRASRRRIVRLLGAFALVSTLAPLRGPGAVAAKGKKRKSADDLGSLVPVPSGDPATSPSGPTYINVDIHFRIRNRTRIRSRTNIRP